MIGQIPLDAVHVAANSDQLILVKDDQSRKRKFEIHELENEPSDFSPDQVRSTPSPSPSLSRLCTSSDQEDQDHDSDDQESRLALEIAKDFRDDAVSGSVDEANDGFRTPTDSDHQIPAAKRCPPAPRKPKLSPELRKVKSTTVRRSLQIEFSRRELEVMFPSTVDFSDPRYSLKFKRPRRD